ncbi:uncharacterized protein METZ01_LOCUS195865 [marine metagenome]|uniref:Uncharacterized protein n=1 Tax=marine metagenome TaxID=408172 RepID=A0A382DZ66_9ZZZZ
MPPYQQKNARNGSNPNPSWRDGMERGVALPGTQG